MESHAKADETFHVTANMVLSLARCSWEIFGVLKLTKTAIFESYFRTWN